MGILSILYIIIAVLAIVPFTIYYMGDGCGCPYELYDDFFYSRLFVALSFLQYGPYQFHIPFLEDIVRKVGTKIGVSTDKESNICFGIK